MLKIVECVHARRHYACVTTSAVTHWSISAACLQRLCSNVQVYIYIYILPLQLLFAHTSNGIADPHSSGAQQDLRVWPSPCSNPTERPMEGRMTLSPTVQLWLGTSVCNSQGYEAASIIFWDRSEGSSHEIDHTIRVTLNTKSPVQGKTLTSNWCWSAIYTNDWQSLNYYVQFLTHEFNRFAAASLKYEHVSGVAQVVNLRL